MTAKAAMPLLQKANARWRWGGCTTGKVRAPGRGYPSGFEYRRDREGAIFIAAGQAASGKGDMRDMTVVRRQGHAVGEHLRRRAVAAVLEKGMSMRAAAQLYEVSESSVYLWVQRFRERGHVRPDRQGGGTPSRIEPERERIFRLLKARPGLSIHGLRKALAAEGRTFSFATVQRFLKRHGLERKKRLAAAELVRKSRPQTGV